jgi:hypothetical protein
LQPLLPRFFGQVAQHNGYRPVYDGSRDDLVQWFLGIGNLTLAGWVTVILYFSTAISCWITARKLQLAAVGVEHARELRHWRSITAAFLALGISTRLDLQTALTETGRVVAKVQGGMISVGLPKLFS